MKHYELGLYEKGMPPTLTFTEKFSECKKAGFDYLELSVDETDEKMARLNWTDAQINEILLASQKAGVPIKSICLSGHRKYPLGDTDFAVRKRSLEIMQKAVQLAIRLGIRIIQIAGYDVFYKQSSEDTRKCFAENLCLSVEMAARAGVILAFETMETPFINTVEKANYWVQVIRSPYLQIYPDVGNITNAANLYGSDVLDDLESGRGHIVAVHLKETFPGVFREVPYGTGHVNFCSVAQKSLELGVRMFVAEFWYQGEENWRENMLHNQEFLRKMLENAWKSARI